MPAPPRLLAAPCGGTQPAGKATVKDVDFAAAIYRLYRRFTRARRYANHRGGRKYERNTKRLLPRTTPDPEKAAAAEIFRRQWQRVRKDPAYVAARASHRKCFEGALARKLQPHTGIKKIRKPTNGNAGRIR
jgi:hypothetical protein